VADRIELQESRVRLTKDGETVVSWWVVRIPEKGRSVRLGLYPDKAQAEAFKRELERGE
jgi:hypothetical protein